MIRTKLDALKKLAQNLGLDPVETARCVTNNDALNLISQYLGGKTGARTNAEAIGNIAEVASAGGGDEAPLEACKILCAEKQGDLVIPEGVTAIGYRAFFNGSSQCGIKFDSVTTPSSLVDIGAEAFQGHFELKSVTLNAGLKTIGSQAFCTCGLASIDIPNSVETIGSAAFGGTALTDINIHKPEDSIAGSPWGADLTVTSINWLG